MTGSLTQTMGGMVSVSCTKEKWEKAKSYMNNIQEHVHMGNPIRFKTLEQ
jgi:hypothetical protein